MKDSLELALGGSGDNNLHSAASVPSTETLSVQGAMSETKRTVIHIPADGKILGKSAKFGDIVTFGTKDNPAKCDRTGAIIPWDKEYVIVPYSQDEHKTR